MSKAEEYAAFLRTFEAALIEHEVVYLTRAIANDSRYTRTRLEFPQCPHERLKIACAVLKEKECTSSTSGPSGTCTQQGTPASTGQQTRPS